MKPDGAFCRLCDKPSPTMKDSVQPNPLPDPSFAATRRLFGCICAQFPVGPRSRMCTRRWLRLRCSTCRLEMARLYPTSCAELLREQLPAVRQAKVGSANVQVVKTESATCNRDDGRSDFLRSANVGR